MEIKQTEHYAKWIRSLKDRRAKLRIDVRISVFRSEIRVM